MLPDGCGLTTMLCDDRRDNAEQLPREKLASLPSPIACERAQHSLSQRRCFSSVQSRHLDFIVAALYLGLAGGWYGSAELMLLVQACYILT